MKKTEARTRFYQVFPVFLLSVFTLAQPAYSSTSDIHTFAGTGPAAYSGDGGPATTAGLSSPAGIAADTAGNIYIADAANNVVRMVDGNGTITTVAGTGSAGYTGDSKTRTNRDGSLRVVKGLPATSAALNSPCAVAFGPSGNMYIADTENSRIRMVDPQGNIFTVAGAGTPGYYGDGGPAAAAQLNMPQGIAVDAAGNLYISDTVNSRVRKVDAGGKITTVAGTGASGYSGDGGSAVLAKLCYPSLISFDPSGNLYIADTFNSRIRKLTPSGQMTTVAGNGVASYSGDGGPATAAAINYPAGVTVDASGNIYISDSYNHRVRKVTASGTITTFAGTGVAGITGDGGPASDAQLDYPSGLATDKAGNIYISDGSANRTRLVEGPSYALPTSTILLPQTGDTIDTANYNITGKANASNGVAFVEVSTDGGNTWNTASGATSFNLSWSPASDGTYRIMSRSTDTLGKRETLMSLTEVTVVAAPVQALTVTTLSPSKPSLTVGDTANWTMAAAGGTGSYEYRVSRRGPDTGGVYMLKRDWTVSDVWAMTASSAMVGVDDVMVEARNSDGSGSVAPKEFLGYSVTVAAPADTTAPSSTVTSPASGSTLTGSSFTITGNATDGTGSGVAKVEVSTDGGVTWNTASGTTSWSYTWNIPSPGGYSIMSRATDVAGNIGAASAGVTVTVAAPVQALTVTTLSPSKPSLTVGDTANWTMAAAGGTGSYEYRVSRRGPDTGGVYMLKRDWTVSDVWAMTASSAMVGVDDVMVEARNSDGSGSVASKEFLGYTVSTVTVSGQAVLAWDASTSTSVSGYKLYVGTSPGVYTRTIDTGSATTYTATGLVSGTTYYFAVTAYDASGTESGYSNQVSRNII